MFQGMYVRILKSRYTNSGDFTLRVELKDTYKADKDLPNLNFQIIPFEEIVQRYRESANNFNKVVVL